MSYVTIGSALTDIKTTVLLADISSIVSVIIIIIGINFVFDCS
ncbi:hypothetical protein BVRB_8g190300 [Beta vulgaris subsp. vulgaris]|nr:hypothetical protein BVRB_8g190300 [Beta vulgaris subsp. vulgaris]